MQSVYIVYENKIPEYIPKPMGKLRFDEPQIPSFIENSRIFEHKSPFKPKFDPIIPKIDPMIPDPRERIQKTSNSIICVCKDLDTAKHYSNMSSDRYIVGPFSLV
jgi:hypothetical protein